MAQMSRLATPWESSSACCMASLSAGEDPEAEVTLLSRMLLDSASRRSRRLSADIFSFPGVPSSLAAAYSLSATRSCATSSFRRSTSAAAWNSARAASDIGASAGFLAALSLDSSMRCAREYLGSPLSTGLDLGGPGARAPPVPLGAGSAADSAADSAGSRPIRFSLSSAGRVSELCSAARADCTAMPSMALPLSAADTSRNSTSFATTLAFSSADRGSWMNVSSSFMRSRRISGSDTTSRRSSAPPMAIRGPRVMASSGVLTRSRREPSGLPSSYAARTRNVRPRPI
mmetsp:Transcript_35690/g.77898  ORF Transcript_35690/g.77898 Transcript_35690/m.77898 type:complete len:288 (-) Transcript_35690:236-1099(-)